MSAATLESPPPGYDEIEWPHLGRMFVRQEATVPLDGGLTGYFMDRDGGACLQAAVATALQRPMEEVPSELTDEPSLLVWADREGLDLEWRKPGVGPRPMGLSVGVTHLVIDRVDYGREPACHTVVLRDGVIFFDPATCFLWPSGEPPAPVTPDRIMKVILFKERSC